MTKVPFPKVPGSGQNLTMSHGEPGTFGKGTSEAPPHIKASDTVAKIYWTFLLSLCPAVLVSILLFRWDALRIFGCSIAAALLAELFAKKVFGREPMLHDGNTIFHGLLFAMMCGPVTPSWVVALCIFVGVLVGKEMFGGTGQYIFNPALVGQAFLHVTFSKSAASFVTYGSGNVSSWSETFEVASLSVSKVEFFLGFGPGMLGEICAPALLFGGLILIGKKIIAWEIPCLYVGVLFAAALTLGIAPWLPLLTGGTYLAAFFIITEPVTTPLTRQGLRVFAVASALLVVLLRLWSYYFYVLPFAILFLNALTPWVDSRIRPRNVRTASS